MHDLAAIRAFNALCQYKSLTSAAKHLDQPKSTLSRRLSQLEEDLGQALLARDGNRLTLTKAGEIYASYAERILLLAEQSEEALQELDQHISGTLTIAVDQNLMRGWISGVIEAFLQAHPNIHLRVISQYTQYDNTPSPDLIICVGQFAVDSYHSTTIGHWRYALYTSPDYFMSHQEVTHPSQLSEHDWIDFMSLNQGGLTLTHADYGTYRLPSFASRLQSDHLPMQADTISKGCGIGLLPTPFAQGLMRSHPEKITPCLVGWHTDPIPINYLYPLGRQPLRLRLFIDMMRAQLPDHWRHDSVAN
ncbi:LysR family transcriptional regulator [Vibrio palustris]|uniref:HTH-type transcriptional regulator CynR n=1 Tax=Vibrio palustris TaxID=1918946 RepID=A0A1R4B7Q8_9VIBR|nr:LysR family transcriptional regulator [Vibrio palustris]SJL84950.1 HTH-type transcriptional regulator CynR [Vibrio palustris]